jgi:hypothetical protein
MREFDLSDDNNFGRWEQAGHWNIAGPMGAGPQRYFVLVSQEKKDDIEEALRAGNQFTVVEWQDDSIVRVKTNQNANVGYEIEFYAKVNEDDDGVSLRIKRVAGGNVNMNGEVDDIMFGTITERVLNGLNMNLPPAQEVPAAGGGGFLAGVLAAMGNPPAQPPQVGGRRGRKARKTRRGRKVRRSHTRRHSKGRKSRGRRS